MRQSEKYWMKVLVLALCLCLSYATYTFHIICFKIRLQSLTTFTVVDNGFSTIFFCCLTKILYFSRILFLPQMCYHTLLKYELNGFDKLS